MNKDKVIFLGIVATFLVAYFTPVGNSSVQWAFIEAFRTLQWYARYHTLPCVVPAMFIAGAISTFMSKEAVLRRLGPRANKIEAYTVASVAGTVLAVCSCSVLPMFAGIYQIGAGLGPASAFLCSGPAINVTAIFLTARVLGLELGVARAVAAIGTSLLVGLLMALIFRKSEKERITTTIQTLEPTPTKRKLWQTALFLATMIAFLVFSDWSNPSTKVLTIKKDSVIANLDNTTGKTEITLSETIRLEVSIERQTSGDMNFQIQNVISGVEALPKDIQNKFQSGARFLVLTQDVSAVENLVPENYKLSVAIYEHRWTICCFLGLTLLAMVWKWIELEEFSDWMSQTWSFAKTIIPLLFGGVFATGLVGASLPSETVAQWVGGNSLRANFIASIIGSLWYFATLTEIPLLQALIGLGMGKGPALTLLLAGPTLSLPSIIVIGRYLGVKKTAVFSGLVVVLSMIVGFVFGRLA